MTVNGEQFEITHGTARAVVCEVGATLRVYESGGVPYVESFAAGTPPPRACGAVLAPWPNRVASGRWTWRGHEQQLALTEPLRDNALHGLVRYADWRCTERTPSAVTLRTRVNVQPGWPVPLLTTIRYALGDEGLRVTHGMTNVGEEEVPFGLGAHCYPRAGDAPTDACVLRLASSMVLPLDEDRRLPQGEPKDLAGVDPALDFRRGRLLAGVSLDTAFAGCAPEPDDARGRVRHAVVGPGTAVEIWADPAFRWVQVCTQPSFPGRGRAVAVEPMTCPPDALRTGTDLIWLRPAESWTGGWGLRPFTPAAP